MADALAGSIGASWKSKANDALEAESLRTANRGALVTVRVPM